MRHMYLHPGECRKILLANYLCIGFVGVAAGTDLFADWRGSWRDFSEV